MGRSLRVSFGLLAVCVLVLAGAGFVYAELPSSPSWSELSPSMTLDERQTEELVYERVNEEREDRGLAALPAAGEVVPVARNHSADMAERSFFDHTDPDGVGPGGRVERAGVDCQDPGENLVRFPRSNHEQPLADDVVDAWLDSPGHRTNLLHDGWSAMAVGVVADDESVYVTQKFCS